MECTLRVARRLLASQKLARDEKKALSELIEIMIRSSRQGISDEAEEIIPNFSQLLLRKNIENNPDTVNNENIIRDRLRDHLINESKISRLGTEDTVSNRKMLEDEIYKFCSQSGNVIYGKSKDETIRYLTEDILDYSVLTSFLLDYENIGFEEIRVNDFNDIRIVKNGREEKTNLSFESSEHLFSVAQKMCRNTGNRLINKENPFIRLRLGNDIRITMMSNPVARRSNEESLVVHMVIRKQSKLPFDREFLVSNGTVSRDGYEFLRILISYGASVNFFGGTNSGKTAAICAFANDIFGKSRRRVITIAEVDELNLRRDDEVSGKARSNTLMWETKGDFDYRKTVNAALTFTPQTIILQEIKGPEVVDVIDAAITGHQILTSSHAKNESVFAKRMLGLYRMTGSSIGDDLIMEYISESFDIIVKMRIYDDGQRRISEISEVLGYERATGKFNISAMYRYDVGFIDRFSDKLMKNLVDNGISGQEIATLESFFANRSMQ